MRCVVFKTRKCACASNERFSKKNSKLIHNFYFKLALGSIAGNLFIGIAITRLGSKLAILTLGIPQIVFAIFLKLFSSIRFE